MSTTRRELNTDLFKSIAERFQYHGKNIYGSPSSENNSPLYSYLCLNASNDPDILTLVANADFATQITNLLFAAVQFLLLSNTEDSLAEYYPNLTARPKPVDDAYPHFRAFCLAHANEIQTLVETRRVQTNEVGRCAGLVPAFNVVASRNGDKPLALVEVGASAGLHLLWDYYYYHYETLGDVGDESSSVKLECRALGAYPPPISGGFPPIASRIGLELHPINLHDESDTRWLQALIWPEHKDRHKLLKAALELAQQHPLNMIGGNAAETLPDVLADMPDDATLCVFHSYVFAQLPYAVREQILSHLLEYSKHHDFFRISQEWLEGWDKPRIELFSYHKGEVQSELLAYSESHGRWIEWLQR